MPRSAFVRGLFDRIMRRPRPPASRSDGLRPAATGRVRSGVPLRRQGYSVQAIRRYTAPGRYRVRNALPGRILPCLGASQPPTILALGNVS
jgi:hypothetical protein